MCPWLVIEWYLDPGVPETADYILSLVKEIVNGYDIDGIHFDYIRYPEEAKKFPDKALYNKSGKKKSLADWRRENINRMVYRIYDWVKVQRRRGVSPPHGALLALLDCVFYAASVRGSSSPASLMTCSDDTLACRIHLGARRAEPLLHIQRHAGSLFDLLEHDAQQRRRAPLGEDPLRQLGENMACLVKAASLLISRWPPSGNHEACEHLLYSGRLLHVGANP